VPKTKKEATDKKPDKVTNSFTKTKPDMAKQAKAPVVTKAKAKKPSPKKSPSPDKQKPADTETKQETRQTKIIKTRSRAYKSAKAKIDVSKYYTLTKAIKLVKDTSLSKFDGKIEAHVNTDLSPGKIGDITFPHLKTKAKKVVIANDKILKDIKAGKINFDVLITTPTFMPKLLPLARILGPKGLMPNPKNGTLTDKPDETVKKLTTAATSLQTEKKAPLIHIIVGLVSQPQKELEANIKQLIKVITPAKIKKLVLCATMGPAVKVKV